MNDYQFNIVKKHFSKITRSALAVMTLFAALTGPSEIANFHQRAFDSHLQVTALDLHIEEIRLVAPGVWLARTKDGKFTVNILDETGSVVAEVQKVLHVRRKDGS